MPDPTPLDQFELNITVELGPGHNVVRLLPLQDIFTALYAWRPTELLRTIIFDAIESSCTFADATVERKEEVKDLIVKARGENAALPGRNPYLHLFTIRNNMRILLDNDTFRRLLIRSIKAGETDFYIIAVPNVVDLYDPSQPTGLLLFKNRFQSPVKTAPPAPSSFSSPSPSSSATTSTSSTAGSTTPVAPSSTAYGSGAYNRSLTTADLLHVPAAYHSHPPCIVTSNEGK